MTAAAKKDDPAHQERVRKNNQATAENGVRCELDGAYVHSIPVHLGFAHPSVSLDEYRRRFPLAPLESEYLANKRKAKEHELKYGTTVAAAATVVAFPSHGATMEPLHEVLGMKVSKAWQNATGQPIMCPVLGAPEKHLVDFVPTIDKNYVFQPDLAVTFLMGMRLNIPTLLWGMHGTGKTTLAEQMCARTNRPFIRIQHTVSTEEAHILGQYVVKGDPETGQNRMVFEPGPLAIAMRDGMTYCADEYDFALPSVTAVYQPVLEGKPLIIKEAPPEWRVVKPHPHFRFVATGNTNGSGDETGLYQGTQIMNAANYSRFGITVKVPYMNANIETEVVQKQGDIHADDARNLVLFAKHVREAYEKGEISVTVSPRELINAARLGLAKGGKWREGMELAYINRLSTIDRKAVNDFSQRVFGGGHASV